MSEFPEGGVAEFDQVVPGRDRLHILLFLIEKKLGQRRQMRARVSLILGALMIVSIALLVVAGVTVQRVYFVGPEYDYSVLDWPAAWLLVVAISPLVMTFMHYLWITFTQMYYRSFNDIRSLLESSDYDEFRPHIPLGILADDGSFLSVIRSLLAVDIGLTSALFAFAGIACAILPVLAQAVTSVVASVILWRDARTLAVGVGLLYVLFLAMALMKTWSLFAFIRRLR